MKIDASTPFFDYFSAIKSKSTQSPKEVLEKHIKENPLRFSYDQNVNYQDYASKYQPQGKIQRKIFAIPSALFAGIVKSIYHLAIAIIMGGIPTVGCIRNKHYFKTYIYRFARDLQEASGYLVTLFNDKRGTYLVQKALFHKACYAEKHHQGFDSRKTFFDFQTSSIDRYVINGVEVPYYSEAIKTSLLQFHQMNKEEQQAAIKKFQLQEVIKELGGEEFFQKLNKANPEILQSASILDLKKDSKVSILPYLLLSDEEFKKVTLKQLEEVSDEQIKFIFQRLENAKPLSTTRQPDQDLLDLPISQLHQVSSQEINAAIDEISPHVFALLQDSQIKELNLSDASDEQVRSLFKHRDYQRTKKRFEMLSQEQVEGILENLNPQQLVYLSDDQLKALKFKDLSKEIVSGLFYYSNNEQEAKRRLALLSQEQVEGILEKLNPYQLRYLSDNQLKALNFKDLSKEVVRELFYYHNNEQEAKRRFALLSQQQVEDVVNKLDRYQLRYLSDDQLKDLNFKDLSKEVVRELFYYHNNEQEAKRRFALLSQQQVEDVVNKLDRYQLKYLSDDQLKDLNFKDLSKKVVRELFYYHNNEQEAKRRFALLSQQQVEDVVNKLDRYQLRYLSDDQLKDLNFKDLSKEIVRELFYYHNNEQEAKRRFALLLPNQLEDILDKLTLSHFNYISNKQLPQIDLSKLSKEKIKILFPSWSKEKIRQEYKGRNYSYHSSCINGKTIVHEKIGFSEDEISKISNERKAIAKSRLSCISQEQLEKIKNKLAPENYDLAR